MKKWFALALALVTMMMGSLALAEEVPAADPAQDAAALEELKAEDNHIIRSWSAAGLPVVSAADSQALIQLQKEYCDRRKCLYCRFGYEYLRHK